jgi:hypothetical protein
MSCATRKILFIAVYLLNGIITLLEEIENNDIAKLQNEIATLKKMMTSMRRKRFGGGSHDKY